jgi:hypothetical protein
VWGCREGPAFAGVVGDLFGYGEQIAQNGRRRAKELPQNVDKI